MASPRKAEAYVSRGDRLPTLQASLTGVVAADLSGATAVLRVMDEAGEESVLTGATIDANALTADYAWTAADVDDDPAGVLAANQYLLAKFKITFAGGKTGHFPNYRWIRVLVTE